MGASDGLQGRAGLLRGVRAATQQMRKDVKAQVEIDAWDIATAGYESVVYSINNTPSAFVDKNNRRYTDLMLNSALFDAKQSGNTTTARAGWLGLKRNYFLIQDQGGMATGNFAGLYVTPMFALRDAKTAMTVAAKKKGYEIV